MNAHEIETPEDGRLAEYHRTLAGRFRFFWSLVLIVGAMLLSAVVKGCAP